MRIALITDGIMPFVTGGMQKHSFYLAKYLALKNCNVTLFHCVYSRDIPNEKEVNNILFKTKKNKIKVVGFKFPESIWFPGHYLYNSYLYSKILYNHLANDINKFDFIYIKGFSGWKLLIEKAKGFKTPPLGINFHGMNMFLPTYGLKSKFINIFLKKIVKKNMCLSDYIFSYGSNVTKTIENTGINANKIIEVPTGIELEFVKDEKKVLVNNTINFVFIGRNDKVKALRELFKAIEKIDNYDFIFHFIGPVDQNLRLPNIVYHGQIYDNKNIIKILDKSDVLILPSYSEGMPNVILEAMSRGLAIIATDVGAVNLMVSDNGILIESPDPILIKYALTEMLSKDKEEIQKMKFNSIITIKENFLWEKIISELLIKLSKLSNN